ncbi:MAG: aminotransferase class I/II-fold pyridoxal phosphate-dependent enzyme [Candidatus Latescibacterota bacterium]|nr:MAG: aminotransferase class I/II-fold pyridoxal phosphate-dependent enzyme [Candidatus Latescibacterota bacterium]
MAHARNRTLDVHLNLNVRGLHPSATVSINERCDELRRSGHEVYKLGLGQSPFPVPRPVIEELRANAHQKAYLPVQGLENLREAVADYHCRTQGIGCSAEHVLIGPGSKELMFLLQLVYYGDLVIPTPAWVSYAPQANIIGRKVRWLHTKAENGWRMAPRELAELCAEDPGRPRIVVLNYPSNPTGSTYKFDELQDLARVARKQRVILLSDEIYGELHHKGQHVSIARFYPEGTIVSAGLSKWCGAGGWRLGTFAFPSSLSWLLKAMAAVASETYTTTSSPIQYAAVRAFQGGMRLERYLWYSRKVLSALGKWIHRRLTGIGLELDRPKGAFYVFPDFCGFRERLRERGIHTSADLCERLLQETGVAILPGTDFGRPAGELTARIAYVDFDGARALAAAEVLPQDRPLDESFLQTYCVQVIQAIDRLCDWLQP